VRLGKDGLLYFIGRHDDMIKSFGRRVSPREVEEVIALMPGIAEVAALGVPDEINGQVVAVFVVAQKKKNIDERTVQAFCRKQLESYKVPKYVWFIDSLRKTSNGKIDKKRLVDMAASYLQTRISGDKRERQ
jgi:acyl-coenzyme A synthetase/AMP-(fatty) acid ligase